MLDIKSSTVCVYRGLVLHFQSSSNVLYQDCALYKEACKLFLFVSSYFQAKITGCFFTMQMKIISHLCFSRNLYSTILIILAIRVTRSMSFFKVVSSSTNINFRNTKNSKAKENKNKYKEIKKQINRTE